MEGMAHTRHPFQHQKRSLTHLIGTFICNRATTFLYRIISITYFFINFNTFLKISFDKFINKKNDTFNIKSHSFQILIPFFVAYLPRIIESFYGHKPMNHCKKYRYTPYKRKCLYKNKKQCSEIQHRNEGNNQPNDNTTYIVSSPSFTAIQCSSFIFYNQYNRLYYIIKK